MSATIGSATAGTLRLQRTRALERALLGVSAYFLVFAYPVLRLVDLLAPQWRLDTPELALILAGPALARLPYDLQPGPRTRLLLVADYQWLGVCLALLPVVLVWEVVHRIIPLPAVASGSLAAGIAAVLLVTGIANALWPRVRRLELEARGLDRPLRLVQLSDLHLGSRCAGFLRQVVRRTRALEPDLVLITGDLADLEVIGERELAPLAEIEAPVCFVIGNHERYVDCEAVCATLGRLGVRVLRDESVTRLGLRIAGIDDADDRGQVARVLDRLALDRLALDRLAPDRLAPDETPYTVLLYHRPDGLDAAARHGVDLMLCGHTHNGQIVPFNWLARRIFPNVCGRYDEGPTTLYVSPGTGTWGPALRIGSRSEITQIDLIPAPRAPLAPSHENRREG